MIKDNQSLPVFLFSDCIKKRQKEGEIKHEHEKAQTRDLKDIYFTPTATKHLSLHHLWNLGGTNSFLGSIHTQWWDANSVVNPWTQLQIELCVRADMLTIEAFSHITGVRAPVTGSKNCPDGSRKFIFSKSWAQVGTPSCCSCAKTNKPPKNGYGGKFPLIRGEAYKNKADGEREKIVFHSVTEVSKPDLCSHPEPRWWILSACTRI